MQPFRFQGQFFDEESGLHYNRHRYYDPKLGTYVTQDPIGLNGGPHAYRYPHNPMTWVDPLGLVVKVVAQDPKEAKTLMEAYARLNKTKRGREITQRLECSKDVYQIRPIEKDAFYCPSGTTAPQCQGQERTVFMDPNNNVKLPTANGMEPASKSTVLGHELGHAIGYKDDGPGAMANVIANENPIRAELGESSRTSYFASSIEWVPGTK